MRTPSQSRRRCPADVRADVHASPVRVLKVTSALVVDARESFPSPLAPYPSASASPYFLNAADSRVAIFSSGPDASQPDSDMDHRNLSGGLLISSGPPFRAMFPAACCRAWREKSRWPRPLATLRVAHASVRSTSSPQQSLRERCALVVIVEVFAWRNLDGL